MANFGKVAVILGGNSAEREVSLRSGEAIYQALIAQDIDAVKIDSARNLIGQLAEQKVDRAFIALHGVGGEDGTIQGLLEFYGIPYTGSGVKASAICMDKWRSKLIWQGLSLPTPKFTLVESLSDLKEFANQVGYPLMVKPSLEGSSIGISKVASEAQLERAFVDAKQTGSSVLAEQFVEGLEFTVGILDGKALPAIQLKAANDFYDYNAKYLQNDTQYIVPCGLESEKEACLQSLALQAYQSLDCHGWGRVDVMQDAKGDFWLIEVNTIPGMTDHSLVPMAAKARGMSFEALVLNILETTL
ncbi:D-alanine--D-alanine ligase [Bermanella marisrubri]|uniref:D-alanine--D-alanine ligase n=1 Tax=Bermanella marisrubri TaxID=207949 RepID=Q1MYC2_9GAMM|nr:D-alanine--D-alanine ligase [Bermanella marisrubri]EAT10945.1 D-alanylalanine synthetase [Oceanobacter sp. RED65] [Bermanella marisrubri]QIZ85093.1 D-alanine--D-alanine ligase [Bermanella marisrubri]